MEIKIKWDDSGTHREKRSAELCSPASIRGDSGRQVSHHAAGSIQSIPENSRGQVGAKWETSGRLVGDKWEKKH